MATTVPTGGVAAKLEESRAPDPFIADSTPVAAPPEPPKPKSAGKPAAPKKEKIVRVSLDIPEAEKDRWQKVARNAAVDGDIAGLPMVALIRGVMESLTDRQLADAAEKVAAKWVTEQ